MNLSTPVPHFATSIPPPAPVVLLLCSTDIVARGLRPLLYRQDLTTVKPVRCVRFHPYSRRSPAREAPVQDTPSQAAGPAPQTACSRRSPSPLTSPSPSPSPSPPQSPIPCVLPEIDDFDPSVQSQTSSSCRIKIPRPKGAGRQNLANLLNWDESTLEAVKVGGFKHVPFFSLIFTQHLSRVPPTN